MVRRLVVLFVRTLLVFAPAVLRGTIEVPPGFVAEKLVEGLNGATAIACAPDGSILIADQTGPLRLWRDGALRAEPVLDLSDRLDTYWERGLIGITLHPQFPAEPYLFVLYVAKEPYTHHVISRFTLAGDRIDPASEKILLQGDDQRRYKAPHPHGHQGGPLRFGPDGKLYAAIGEQTAGEPAQRLDNIIGKILRLNPDGTIPADNPYYDQAQGKYRAIYAIGLRNVFGLAFQPGTGRLFATDVGQTSWEEVNEIRAGANYGWPQAEGQSAAPGLVTPLHAYPPAIGRSIVGAGFAPVRSAPKPGTAPGERRFPEPWSTWLFFGDWAANWVKAMDPNPPHHVKNFARGFSGPVAVEFAPDGSLLVLERGTIWIDRVKFVAKAGALTRVRYVGGEAAEATASTGFPLRLSQTRVFARVETMEPAAGFEAFELNAPIWLPGVKARRWISVPGDGQIQVTADGYCALPSGSVIVQHFDLLAGAPLETHVYWSTPKGVQAAAYQWEEDGRDAVLVPESSMRALPGDPGRQWHSPGPESQLNAAATVSGFVLQLTVGQLNRDVATPRLPVYGGRPAAESRINQLALWNRRGWLAEPLSNEAIAALPRLAALDDASASAEWRVRSYLEANCASCHYPGGPARSQFDARASRPLAEAGLLHAIPIAGDLGIKDARIVVPGDPRGSLLLQRLLDGGAFRMPPVRLSEETPPVVPVMEQWIRTLQP